MHVIMASVGTDGDILPYVGLGATLRERGHRVTLLANEHFQPMAADQGLGFQALVSNDETQELLGNPDFWHPVKAARVASRWGARFIRRQYELLAELAHGEDAVLVASPGVLAGRLVQETLSRPLASVILQPWMIPSVQAPPVMPGGLALPAGTPKPIWRLYWRLLDAAGDWLMGRELNGLRAGLGLEPVRRLFQWWLSPELVLGMFPDWYGPPQTDWPAAMRLVGFPNGDGRSTVNLPADLSEFCRAGSPPVAFTFGTGMMHAAGLFREAIKACELLNARAILLTRYANQLPDELPGFVRHCEFASFAKLFPQCAVVVHHGGIGTTAAALAAGAPQLILPFAYDQEDNATRVKRLGAGDWLKHRRRDSRQMASALVPLMTTSIKTRCQTLAARFGGGLAFATAAQWIEELAQKRTKLPQTNSGVQATAKIA